MLQKVVEVGPSPSQELYVEEFRIFQFLDPVSDGALRGSNFLRDAILLDPARNFIPGVIRLAPVPEQQGVHNFRARANFRAAQEPLWNHRPT